jgi:glutathione S-transferase
LLIGLAFRRFGHPVNEALLKSHENQLERKLDGFERLLKKQKYIAGDVCLRFQSRRVSDLHYELKQHLTVVDLYFLPYGEVLEKAGYDYLKNEAKWPNVARWWAEITARPSWQIVKGGIPAEYLGEE